VAAAVLEAAARDRAAMRLRVHPWPEPLRSALDRLRRNGGQAYLVGGTVRDVVLGRGDGEVADVATDLPPDEVTARFSRVEPIGLVHGTVLIVEPGLEIECTTFRREGAYPDARHPERVEFTRDPLEDLRRRDLTVNALAFDPATGVLLDPHGGALDLERRRLRAVGDPVARFQEDALRPLRAARLAAVLEFDLDADTEAAMAGTVERAGLVAMERVREEWVRMMRAQRPSIGIELLRRAGLLARWAPEIDRCWGVPQNRYHAYDVYEHSLRAVDAAPADKPRVRWAALLHDIGKPETREMRRGDATFYGHDKLGAERADRMLERFRFPTAEREAIVHLVREHMFDVRSDWSEAAIRRWLARVGIDAVADLFDLRIADALATGRRDGFPSTLEGLRARIERLQRADLALSTRDLAIDGHDVMEALGIGPGPVVGIALDAMLEVVLEHPERNRRDVLLAEVARWARGRMESGSNP
jgi:tRNA nucleotidyltransferase (CCA-adding enzyme)